MKASLMAQNEMSGPVFKMKNDPRVTKVGRIIRKTSIDELPQLYDVFRGKMSLVGPRPLPLVEEDGVTGIYKARELVKPGITCFWQITGRNRIDFDDWMELDLKYIKEQNIWTDVKILVKTIPAVFSGGGVLRPFGQRTYFCCKRLFDILATLLGLLIVVPLLIPFALVIKIETPNNIILFHLPRIGRDWNQFFCHKLSSVVPDAERLLEQLTEEEIEEFAETFNLKHDSRITKVGWFIRKTSIDELPQLWNVLVGCYPMIRIGVDLTLRKLEKYLTGSLMLL